MKLKDGRDLSHLEIIKRLNIMGIGYNPDIIGKNYYIDLYNKAIKSPSNIEKIKKEIKSEKSLKGLLTFDLDKDLEALDEMIIKEYTRNTFYGDLNRWLMNSKMNSFEAIAYFTARLMYSLNIYGKDNKMYCDKDKKQLKRGIKIPYSCL